MQEQCLYQIPILWYPREETDESPCIEQETAAPAAATHHSMQQRSHLRPHLPQQAAAAQPPVLAPTSASRCAAAQPPSPTSTTSCRNAAHLFAPTTASSSTDAQPHLPVSFPAFGANEKQTKSGRRGPQADRQSGGGSGPPPAFSPPARRWPRVFTFRP